MLFVKLFGADMQYLRATVSNRQLRRSGPKKYLFLKTYSLVRCLRHRRDFFILLIIHGRMAVFLFFRGLGLIRMHIRGHRKRANFRDDI